MSQLSNRSIINEVDHLFSVDELIGFFGEGGNVCTVTEQMSVTQSRVCPTADKSFSRSGKRRGPALWFFGAQSGGSDLSPGRGHPVAPDK